jgi:hypothetical protein
MLFPPIPNYGIQNSAASGLPGLISFLNTIKFIHEVRTTT